MERARFDVYRQPDRPERAWRCRKRTTSWRYGNRSRRRPIWAALRLRSPRRRHPSNNNRLPCLSRKKICATPTIVSPIDGIVLSRDRDIGDAVGSILLLGSSATLIMTVGDLNEVYVKVVDETDIGKVYLGQPARISVESFKDQKFQGRVTKISPMEAKKDNVTRFRSPRIDLERKTYSQSSDDRQCGDPSRRA